MRRYTESPPVSVRQAYADRLRNKLAACRPDSAMIGYYQRKLAAVISGQPVVVAAWEVSR